MFVLHKPGIATLVGNRTQTAADLHAWKTVSRDSTEFSWFGVKMKNKQFRTEFKSRSGLLRAFLVLQGYKN
jgi:hypothetical protein